ncbi:MAG: DUF3006 domain-containing protein [Oscillospiraceae bacterium]
MYFSVEAIEEDFAKLVGDDERVVSVKINLLPKNVQVGDLVRYLDNKYIIDENATKIRQQRIKNKLNDILGHSAIE